MNDRSFLNQITLNHASDYSNRRPEPEPPKPPRGIQVKLVNYDRLDYQVSWHPPLPTKVPTVALPSGTSHPTSAATSSAAFTRYRVMLAPRKEEPVDASMYNDEAGFSPIPDLQYSDVRVLDKVGQK